MKNVIPVYGPLKGAYQAGWGSVIEQTKNGFSAISNFADSNFYEAGVINGRTGGEGTLNAGLALLTAGTVKAPGGLARLGNLATKNKYAYRSLTAADAASLNAGNGISAKALNGTWSLEQHLINGSSSKARLNNPWIATSTDINVARSFSSGNGLIRINLSKLPASSAQKGWMSLPRSFRGYHFSIWQQEVSIFQNIPKSAIKIIE